MSSFLEHFALNPQLNHLNHGSFGACPKAVLEEQGRIRAEIEADAMDFFLDNYPGYLDQAREALAKLISAPKDRLVFVQNATTAVNTVLRSFPLQPGDQILTNDHEYGACLNALDEIAAAAGAEVQKVKLSTPIASEASLSEELFSQVTDKTRLVMLSHIASPTGVVFPLERWVPELEKRGIATLIDGAHAVGQVPLDLTKMGVSYYTSNCHKWLCAPKGCAFLYVREDAPGPVRPLVLSHAAKMPEAERFLPEFDWPGTLDPSPYLSVPKAIETLNSFHDKGLEGLMKRNQQLALRAREILLDSFPGEKLCPDSMLGSLATVKIPNDPQGNNANTFRRSPLQMALRERGFHVPIVSFPECPQRLARVSAQIYNHEAQYQELAQHLKELLKQGL